MHSNAVNYFTVSPLFPTAEDLPFGSNSIVAEVRYSENTWYRFYLPAQCFFYLQKPSGSSPAQFVVAMPQLISYASTGTNRGYFHTRNSNYDFGSLQAFTASQALEDNYVFYTLNLTSYITQSTYQFFSNYTSYNTGDSWNSSLRAYPSDAGNIVSRVNDNVDREVSSLNAQESRRAATEASQQSRQHADDMTQRSQQHSEIMHAGSDQPTLDTNNDWMDDSLSKVNGWLDDISNFEVQLSNNRVENASNLTAAQNFISGFTSSLPVGVIAALSLVIVMIVVIKIVGR